MRLRILLAFVLTAGAGAEAGQRISLSVAEAVNLGLDNSKALHASFTKVNYADARAAEAGAARLPSLGLIGAYTRLSDVPPFVVSVPLPPPAPSSFTLSPSIVNNYNLRLSVQQPLFTGFRLDAASEMADYSVRAASDDYAKDRSDLVFNVKKAYWTLYKAMEMKNLIDENVSQIEAHVKDVQNLMEQGMATTNDVLKVQVQLSDAQLRQLDAANAVRLATVALNSTIGIPLQTEVELTTEISHEPKGFPGLDSLVERAMSGRPDVQAMNDRIKASEAGVSVARSGWYPQVYLTGNYYYSRPNQRILPTQDLFKDTWDVGVSVSFNIWNWGATLHQTDQAEAQLEAARDAAGLIADRITLEVTQDYLNLRQAAERIDVARKGVEQAEENYRITDQRFKEGLALNSDLLDAEVALLQAKTNHTQSLVDYEVAQARLETAIGQ